jgi:hypothetical protein
MPKGIAGPDDSVNEGNQPLSLSLSPSTTPTLSRTPNDQWFNLISATFFFPGSYPVLKVHH